MFPYWLLFFLFAAGALLEQDPLTRRPSRGVALLLAVFAAGLMVGVRYEVGADWFTYDRIFAFSRHIPVDRMVRYFGDPAYSLLTWGVAHSNGEIWQVNLVCGLIFGWGLLRFVRTQSNPWLAACVAIPYLVIVVAMGYTRQAVAIGILMAGLASVARGASTSKFAVYVVAAALFHKTAVVMLPLVAFSQTRTRFVNVLVGVALSVIFYDLFLSESVNYFYKGYIKAEYSSQGATIRIILNVVPAALYLLNRSKFDFSLVDEGRLWYYFSLASFLLLGLLIVVPSSTAVDRIALYIIPIQLAIWSRVPQAFGFPRLVRLLVVGFSAAVLFTWLNFAAHSRYWLPYQMVPLVS